MSGNSPVSEKIIVFEIAGSYNTVSLEHWGHFRVFEIAR